MDGGETSHGAAAPLRRSLQPLARLRTCPSTRSYSNNVMESWRLHGELWSGPRVRGFMAY